VEHSYLFFLSIKFFTETTGESVTGEWSPLIVTEDVEKILYEVGDRKLLMY